MEGLSIIISAWKSKPYIKGCLDSIYNSTYIKQNKPFEVLLGIDGDEELLDYVITIKNKYKNLKCFNNENNVGTYIMFNSLVQYSHYDIIMRFDSDDTIQENSIEDGFNYLKHNNNNFILFGNILNGLSPKGAFMIDKSIFNELNGFKPFRVSCDMDFFIRLLNSSHCAIIGNSGFYYNNSNENQLTKLVKINSKERMEIDSKVQSFENYKIKTIKLNRFN